MSEHQQAKSRTTAVRHQPVTRQQMQVEVPGKKRRPSFLAYFNLALAFVLTVCLAGITTRMADGEGEKHSLQIELAATQHQVMQLESDQQQRLEAAMNRNSSAFSIQQKKREEERRAWAGRVETLDTRLEELENKTSQDRAETAANLQAELVSLSKKLHEELDQKSPASEIFREFERSHRDGIVLIYTEFDYHYLKAGRRMRKKTVTGWGTGFFATDEGHIVTNKHVVHPWKFDSDLMAMEAMDDISINRNSLRLYCWQGGVNVLGPDGSPSSKYGFNSHEKHNLKVFAVAPDAMSNENLDYGPEVTHYRVHDLNNNDLAILKASGGPFAPLPLAGFGTADPVKKLDPVMAIGFPRGKRGLERDCAESSPSIGTVRKVENTIHITASIIPGNSGGPLVGPDGRVVGIVTRIYSETLGICIRIHHALDLIKSGRDLAKSKAEKTSATQR